MSTSSGTGLGARTAFRGAARDARCGAADVAAALVRRTRAVGTTGCSVRDVVAGAATLVARPVLAAVVRVLGVVAGFALGFAVAAGFAAAVGFVTAFGFAVAGFAAAAGAEAVGLAETVRLATAAGFFAAAAALAGAAVGGVALVAAGRRAVAAGRPDRPRAAGLVAGASTAAGSAFAAVRRRAGAVDPAVDAVDRPEAAVRVRDRAGAVSGFEAAVDGAGTRRARGGTGSVFRTGHRTGWRRAARRSLRCAGHRCPRSSGAEIRATGRRAVRR